MMNSVIAGAIGLSVTFMGVMLSIVTIGILFFIHRTTTKKKERGLLIMAGLIFSWAIFLALNSQTSSSIDYVPMFFVYSVAHIFSIFVGVIILVSFGFMFSKLQKVFNKKYLIIAGSFACLSILTRIIFPFFRNPYLSLTQRIIVIIPSLLGFFMIIKSTVSKSD